MGRFFLPLYPILVFGLPAVWRLAGRQGNIARIFLFAALFYSAVFALAGAAYGLQGVMEPGVWTLRQRLMAEHYKFYQGLLWVAVIPGVLGEVLNQVLRAAPDSAAPRATRQARQGVSRRTMVDSRLSSRRRRGKK
jgi:hypothetical protein